MWSPRGARKGHQHQGLGPCCPSPDRLRHNKPPPTCWPGWPAGSPSLHAGDGPAAMSCGLGAGINPELSPVVPGNLIEPLLVSPPPANLQASTEAGTRAGLSYEPHLLTYKIRSFVSPRFRWACMFSIMTPATEKHAYLFHDCLWKNWYASQHLFT